MADHTHDPKAPDRSGRSRTAGTTSRRDANPVSSEEDELLTTRSNSASLNSAQMSAGEVLQLQGLIGNRATAALLNRTPRVKAQAPPDAVQRGFFEDYLTWVEESEAAEVEDEDDDLLGSTTSSTDLDLDDDDDLLGSTTSSTDLDLDDDDDLLGSTTSSTDLVLDDDDDDLLLGSPSQAAAPAPAAGGSSPAPAAGSGAAPAAGSTPTPAAEEEGEATASQTAEKLAGYKDIADTANDAFKIVSSMDAANLAGAAREFASTGVETLIGEAIPFIGDIAVLPVNINAFRKQWNASNSVDEAAKSLEAARSANSTLKDVLAYAAYKIFKTLITLGVGLILDILKIILTLAGVASAGAGVIVGLISAAIKLGMKVFSTFKEKFSLHRKRKANTQKLYDMARAGDPTVLKLLFEWRVYEGLPGAGSIEVVDDLQVFLGMYARPGSPGAKALMDRIEAAIS